MKPDYSILIPTWNNLDLLKKCISSIRAHSHHNFQLLIYVNEGSDGTQEWLSQEGILFLESSTNVGICVAMNALRKIADAPILCYLNDDMYVLPNWDTYVLAEINKTESDFFISSTMIEPNAAGNACSINGDYGNDLDSFREKELLAEHADFAKKDWSGSAWPPLWVTAKLWDKIGGFSEEFSPGMYSDPDMAMKAWDAGTRIFKGIAESRVYHFGSKSTKRLGVNTGRKIFLQKWGITARYFYKYYLRMGEPYQGALGEPKHPFLGLLINKMKKQKSS
ncbi:glycosyltransferase family 2 protein [Portibacter lacus]|uniref:Glycosyltransferase 2-like domain-containing protein n=1 Tax=Portibacter lacus TaxID=1099794 RepID=A0AA37WDN3_9BACT|nr:glycosyltransferase [Portibacter lacus]GLR18086.1 hypothetical protein GCM10007940_27010 [Portibacter lacus]